MALLTTTELAALRQGISNKFKPETWLKQDLSAALQAVEDVRVSLGLNPVDAVNVTNVTDGRATAVQAAKTAGRISADILPVIDDWLAENPPTRTGRSVDEVKLSVWITSNRVSFAAAVVGIPALIQDATVLTVLRLRVEAEV